ncbi:MAG TPA: hypothetical protein VJ807_02730 [Gaiellaceae bacterium]|nr:hypothetical protein [Gaiellaceae bacterium]
MGVELLWTIFEWLPLVFAIDVLAFHATGDHPLGLRWWWRRSSRVTPQRAGSTRREYTVGSHARSESASPKLMISCRIDDDIASRSRRSF